MESLNFPKYDFRTRNSKGKQEIFDPVRGKFVALEPEEWVRQHLIRFLNEEKKHPLSWMAVEREIKVHGLRKRCDVVVYKSGRPVLIAECKAPSVHIGQREFDQAARYNLSLAVPYLLLTNGLDRYCAFVDREEQRYKFLREVPGYGEIQ